MASWRGSVLAANATKAGSASEATRLTPRPPSLTGRLACSHWVSDRTDFVMRSIADLRRESNRSSEGCDTDGEQRSRWRTLWALKDEHSRINASWEPRVANLSTALPRSSQRSDQVLSSTGLGNKAAPKMVASLISTLLKDWANLSETASSQWDINSHFSGFRIKPISAPASLISATSRQTESVGPPISEIIQISQLQIGRKTI